MMQLFLDVLYLYGVTVGIVTTGIIFYGWRQYRQQEPKPRANLRRLK